MFLIDKTQPQYKEVKFNILVNAFCVLWIFMDPKMLIQWLTYLNPVAKGCVNEAVDDDFCWLFDVEVRLSDRLVILDAQYLTLEQKWYR